MGAWGTGISSNDTYADIYGQFIDLYNDGYSPSEISDELVRANQETIEMYEDAPNFWYAIANAQWECNALQNDVLERVRRYIDSKEDLNIWEELGATKADLKAREKVLRKFLEKLETTKKNPRRRKTKKFFDSLFTKGDCLVYRMSNGNYGGAFVLTDEHQTEFGQNYIAITTIDSPVKPTLEDFEKAEVLVRREDQYRFEGMGNLVVERVDQPQIGGFLAESFKLNPIEIEVIGRLRIVRDYKIERIVVFGWIVLSIVVPGKAEYEEKNGTPKTRLFLTEWTKRKWNLPFMK